MVPHKGPFFFIFASYLEFSCFPALLGPDLGKTFWRVLDCFYCLFYPFGPFTSAIPACPACFRGLEPEIDSFRQCTLCILIIPVEIVNTAHPELVLKGSGASI